jgi:hypothetical protein
MLRCVFLKLWIGLLFICFVRQKKSGGNVSPLAKSPGKNLNKPNWVVKAQKMQSQEV